MRIKCPGCGFINADKCIEELLECPVCFFEFPDMKNTPKCPKSHSFKDAMDSIFMYKDINMSPIFLISVVLFGFSLICFMPLTNQITFIILIGIVLGIFLTVIYKYHLMKRYDKKNIKKYHMDMRHHIMYIAQICFEREKEKEKEKKKDNKVR